MLSGNREKFQVDLRRLQNGLEKLAQAKQMVNTMQVELGSLGPQIEYKQQLTEKLLQQLIKDTSAVNDVSSAHASLCMSSRIF